MQYSAQEGGWDFPTAEETARPQSSVPVESGSASSSSAASSASSAASSAPQASAAPSSSSNAPESSTAPSASAEPQPTLAYLLPVSGSLDEPFSNGKLVRCRTMGDWRTHNGVDLTAAEGAPVRAAADGVVSNVNEDDLWGTVVHILHSDGNTSVYACLDRVVTVAVGDSVAAGEIIGAVGSSVAESAQQPHLHFAMLQAGEWIDPSLYVALPAAAE